MKYTRIDHHVQLSESNLRGRNPSLYGWKSVDGSWEPVWFEGKQYFDPTEQDKSEVEGVKPDDGN